MILNKEKRNNPCTETLNVMLFIILIRWYYAWTNVKWKKISCKIVYIVSSQLCGKYMHRKKSGRKYSIYSNSLLTVISLGNENWIMYGWILLSLYFSILSKFYTRIMYFTYILREKMKTFLRRAKTLSLKVVICLHFSLYIFSNG